jgi:hypothetical protein
MMTVTPNSKLLDNDYYHLQVQATVHLMDTQLLAPLPPKNDVHPGPAPASRLPDEPQHSVLATLSSTNLALQKNSLSQSENNEVCTMIVQFMMQFQSKITSIFFPSAKCLQDPHAGVLPRDKKDKIMTNYHQKTTQRKGAYKLTLINFRANSRTN